MIKKEQALPGRTEEEKLSNVHFVLKTPVRGPFPAGLQEALFATGCYWGTEKGFWRMPGVYSTAVGYAGGFTPNPSYEEACSGMTGHTEGVKVVYDPEKISYADLLRQFCESHNPTQYMGQGNDRGSQYRSAIYTFTEDQAKLAVAALKAYQEVLGKPICTEVAPMSKAGPFYFAHEGYQQYLARPGSRPYCSAEPQCKSLPPYEKWAPDGLSGDHSPKLPQGYWDKHAPKPHCVIREPNHQLSWP
mmetsp:Transcript_16892/g.32989  ORF Transcript_16892/g.32989 Transcript_16892/m.32989 type:complete len:246 (+) Transcript_16892:36-773(+)